MDANKDAQSKTWRNGGAAVGVVDDNVVDVLQECPVTLSSSALELPEIFEVSSKMVDGPG